MKTHKRKKTQKTRDPKVRRHLINRPAVKSYKDFNAPGLIRVLDREKDKFPEFAFYPRARNAAKIEKSLRFAGLRQEEKGLWILRTDMYSIFVYLPTWEKN